MIKRKTRPKYLILFTKNVKIIKIIINITKQNVSILKSKKFIN
jgi:hypothetical protein